MKLKEKNFPLSFEYRINVSEYAYEMIGKHAIEDKTVEICGVLIGELYKDDTGPYLEIIDIIKGEYADNKSGEVKFTHETWSFINSKKDSEFKDLKIVGWYHSHPNFGIFLSDQDMFIHRNFFNQSWQVAYVIDAIRNEDGFFIWHSGKAIRKNEFWIEGFKKEKLTPPYPVETEPQDKAINKQEELKNESNDKSKTYYYILALLVFTTLLVLAYPLVDKHLFKMFKPPSTMTTNGQIFPIQIISPNPIINGIKLILEKKGNNLWCKGQVYTLYQKELISKALETQDNFESIDMRGVIVTHSYKVQSNETLKDISKKVYGSDERWQDILKINKYKIHNPNILISNTELILPE